MSIPQSAPAAAIQQLIFVLTRGEYIRWNVKRITYQQSIIVRAFAQHPHQLRSARFAQSFWIKICDAVNILAEIDEIRRIKVVNVLGVIQVATRTF